MTLERPLLLLLLLALPLLWLWLRRYGSRACLALKSAAFAALAIALAGPWAEWSEQRLAVTVVMDASASMPRSALKRGEELLRELMRKNSDAELRLVTFAENPRLHGLPQQAEKVVMPQHPGAAMGTDLEAALRLALSTFPNVARGECCSSATAMRPAATRSPRPCARGSATCRCTPYPPEARPACRCGWKAWRCRSRSFPASASPCRSR